MTATLAAAVIGGRDVAAGGLATLEHRSPRDRREMLWRAPICGEGTVEAAVCSARAAQPAWAGAPLNERIQVLRLVADRLSAAREDFSRAIAVDTGKPIRDSRGEVELGVAFARAACDAAERDAESEVGRAGWRARRMAVGTVGIVTPWNNPLAIPLGKLGPALVYGNAAIWKPSPGGAGVGAKVMTLLQDAGLPDGVVCLLQGDRTTAERLATHPGVDAVSFTGSAAGGESMHLACAVRHVPFQGELGGNNAAIVWGDADIEKAARLVARGAFGAAGQRCTANRRAVVDDECYGPFLERLVEETARLTWGDPLTEETDVGPLISSEAVSRVAEMVDRAAAAGATIVQPHLSKPGVVRPDENGCYFPATIVCCDDAAAEIVQEETFSPVLVVQRARGWEDAIRLVNGVRQGLVAALFSKSEALQREFLDRATAGILKINQATAGAASDAPFGGWKGSGIGPFEHGPADAEFYSRRQTVYYG